MASPLNYTVVDAFTNNIFAGNPASVIVLDHGRGLPDATLQLIAREFNLSETAFVTPKTQQEQQPDGGTRAFHLRWFTPNLEMALCGHATLASAHVLFSSPALVPEDAHLLTFDTLSGTLTARRLPGGEIELEFPAGAAKKAGAELEARAREAISSAFGACDGVYPDVKFVGVGEGISFEKYMLVELDSAFNLEKAGANPYAFAALAPQHTIIIVTAAFPNAGARFHSRVFAPLAGVPEDPVTGSAHCMLGPYWHSQLGLRGAQELVARQVSERGGDLTVVWDEQKGTCRLRGRAVVAAKGEFYAPV